MNFMKNNVEASDVFLPINHPVDMNMKIKKVLEGNYLQRVTTEVHCPLSVVRKITFSSPHQSNLSFINENRNVLFLINYLTGLKHTEYQNIQL